MNNISEKINQAIKLLVKQNFDVEVGNTVEQPKDKTHGDFASSVALQLAGRLKKNPLEIAEEISKNLKSQISEIKSIDIVKPGFINFKLQNDIYIQNIKEILDKGEEYGRLDNISKNVIVEFSSPNIAKPFTIGHLRSTIIGDSIARILEFSGSNVFRDNHLGDWGASFGKYLAAFDEYNVDLESLKKSERPVKELVNLYIKFNKDAEENPELIEKSRDWFKKLEDGDKTAREWWKECIEISLIEFNRIYRRLDINFTENEGKGYGESFFEDKMPEILNILEETHKVEYKESEGAKLVFFDKKTKLPPLMILKSNGTTLYSTRDLATDYFRKNREEYGSDLTVINETGIEQELYWRQIFKIEEELGWYKPGQRVFIGHGLYKFKDSKMSTRKGNIIWLEDVFNKLLEKLEEKSEEKLEGNSEKLAIGSLKWNDLKRSPQHNIIFDWDEILNIEGNSNPYIQYTYVRANSIIEKQNDIDTEVIDPKEDIELELVKLLADFKSTIESAAKNYSPHLVCNYLYELAQTYNKFYTEMPVLKAEEKEMNSRLAITKATAQVIKNGLKLLGIETVEKM